MNSVRKVAILACLTAVVACGPNEPAPEPQAGPVAEDADVATTAGQEPEAAQTDALRFEPESLSACDIGGQVVTVHWDVSSIPGVTDVEVVPIVDGVPSGILAKAGVQGSKETGAWMEAGGTLAVLNAANGEELARASIGSIPCDQ